MQELVLCAIGTAQAQPAEPQDALEMGKQHLDFLAFIAGAGEGRCACQRSGNIARLLMDIARDFPRWRVRATARL